jgi:hypothetical protein
MLWVKRKPETLPCLRSERRRCPRPMGN